MCVRAHSLSTLASYSMSEQLNCYAAIIYYLAHLVRKGRRKVTRWYLERLRRRRSQQKAKARASGQIVSEEPKGYKCCSCCKSVRYRNSPPTVEKPKVTGNSLQRSPERTTTVKRDSCTNRKANHQHYVKKIDASGIRVPVAKSDIPGVASVLIDCHVIPQHKSCCVESNPSDSTKPNTTESCPSHKKSESKRKAKVSRKSSKNVKQESKDEDEQPPTSTSATMSLLPVATLAKSCSKHSLWEKAAPAKSSSPSERHCSAPNLFTHYYHHHHPNRPPVFLDRAKASQIDQPHSSKLTCDMITTIKDNNELQNMTIRLAKPTTLQRKLSQGTISWDSSSFVQNEPEAIEPEPSSGQSQPAHPHLYHRKPNRGHRCSEHHHHHHYHHHHTGHHRSSCSSVFSSRSHLSRRASSITSSASCRNCCPQKQSDYFWKFWRRFRKILQSIVNHTYFKQAIFLAILFNTFSMGIEYHNQPPSLSHAVEISNAIFTGKGIAVIVSSYNLFHFVAIFCCEMMLKLVADGFYEYIKSGFNVFDGSIVILSLLELFEEHGSGLSVLRTFRLLRILKLVRFMPALRRQLVIMLRTIDNVAVFFALLILFIFIFR